MKTYEVLERALALIEDPANWQTGYWGLDSDDSPTCAVGALARAQGFSSEAIHERGQGALIGFKVLNALAAAANPARKFPTALEGFNDTRSHAEVVELFQAAIRAEKVKAGVLVDVPAEAPQEVPHA